MFQIIQEIDESILFYIQEHLKNPAMDQFMIFFTKLGNAGLIWIMIAFILLCRKDYKRCGIPLICSIPIALFLCDDVLKPIFGRLRPNMKFTDIPLLIPGIHSFSFPSGHTTIGFAAATAIFLYHKKQGVLAYIIASLIAFSRMYLFVHYPTDILGGVILGVVTAHMVVYGAEKLFNYCPDPQMKPPTKPQC